MASESCEITGQVSNMGFEIYGKIPQKLRWKLLNESIRTPKQFEKKIAAVDVFEKIQSLICYFKIQQDLFPKLFLLIFE